MVREDERGAGPCIEPHHFLDGSEIVEKGRPLAAGARGPERTVGQVNIRQRDNCGGASSRSAAVARLRCWPVVARSLEHTAVGSLDISSLAALLFLACIFSPSSPRGENSARGSPGLLSSEFDWRTNLPQPPSSAITAPIFPPSSTKSIGWAASFPGRQ